MWFHLSLSFPDSREGEKVLSKILLGHQQDKPKAKTGEDGIRAHRGCIRIIRRLFSSETC